jgi:hypothetical protein
MLDLCLRGVVSLVLVSLVACGTHKPLQPGATTKSLVSSTQAVRDRALSPFAVFDWHQTGADSSRLSITLGWSNAPDADLEYVVWTSLDSRFGTKPTSGGSDWIDHRPGVPVVLDFTGLDGSSVAHTLVGIRDENQIDAEIHYTEFSGVHRKELSSCRVAYHHFRADDRSTVDFDQPQVGGTIGFRKVKDLFGNERIEVQVDGSSASGADRLHVTFKDIGAATAQQAYVWVSSAPTRPWDFRSFDDASLRGGRRLQGSDRIQLDSAHHNSREVAAPGDAEELHLYLVVSELDPNGRLVYWHYWTHAPVDVRDLHAGDGTAGKVVRIRLRPEMFDRAVSAYCESNPLR